MIRLDMSKNKTSTSVSMSTTNIFLYPWIVKQIFAGLLFTKLKLENMENDKKSCPWHQCHIFAKNPVHDISVTFLQKRPVHDISVTLLQKRRMLFCVKLSYFFVHIYILPVISLFFTSFFCLSCVFTPTEKTQKVMIMKNAAHFWRRK